MGEGKGETHENLSTMRMVMYFSDQTLNLKMVNDYNTEISCTKISGYSNL